MNDFSEFSLLIIYIVLGLVGAFAHWFKKRYKDKTTVSTMAEYVSLNFNNTLYALGSMLFTELVLANSSNILTLSAIIAALTAGYTCDSALNKAPDSP